MNGNITIHNIHSNLVVTLLFQLIIKYAFGLIFTRQTSEVPQLFWSTDEVLQPTGSTGPYGISPDGSTPVQQFHKTLHGAYSKSTENQDYKQLFP